MPIIETPYTDAELSNVPRGPHEFISANSVLEILETSRRVYGLAAIDQGDGSTKDQIVRIQGQRDLDGLDLHCVWVSGTTFADMVKRA